MAVNYFRLLFALVILFIYQQSDLSSKSKRAPVPIPPSSSIISQCQTNLRNQIAFVFTEGVTMDGLAMANTIKEPTRSDVSNSMFFYLGIPEQIAIDNANNGIASQLVLAGHLIGLRYSGSLAQLSTLAKATFQQQLIDFSEVINTQINKFLPSTAVSKYYPKYMILMLLMEQLKEF
eukprot:NODE_97_length_20652_cov_0.832093.p12 type:complete len:177 gc:universal NODE_97_length_20652_cov_0.832093:12895-12365(-)